MSKHLQKISFFLDHPRGSVFKNDISDEFLLLKSPSRNSSDLQVFRVFPHVKTSFRWIISPRESLNKAKIVIISVRDDFISRWIYSPTLLHLCKVKNFAYQQDEIFQRNKDLVLPEKDDNVKSPHEAVFRDCSVGSAI